MRRESLGLVHASKSDRAALTACASALKKRKEKWLEEKAGVSAFTARNQFQERSRKLSRQKYWDKKCGSREEMLTGKKSAEQLAEIAKAKRLWDLRKAWAKTA